MKSGRHSLDGLVFRGESAPIDGLWQAPQRAASGQATAAPRARKVARLAPSGHPFRPRPLYGDMARVTDDLGDWYVFIAFVWRAAEVFVRRFVAGQSKQAGGRTYFGHKTLLLIQRRKSRRAIGFEETGNV